VVDLSRLSSAIIEKQGVILNNLVNLSHEELMKMMVSLSAIISNLEKLQTQEDIKCNKIMAIEFSNDSRASFSKVEVLMKASDTYLEYKNVMNLKQCALRELSLVKIQVQYYLKSEIDYQE
jgi:hypothetical protein